MATQRRAAEAPARAEETVLEHISERQDRTDDEIALLHNVLPHSSATSPVPRAANPLHRRLSAIKLEESDSLANSKKFNSTSTLFVDSTVSAPNLEDTLQTVALALHYIILDGHRQDHPNLYSSQFDEKRFPLTDKAVPDTYASDIPPDTTICRFLSKIFQLAALSAECGIITLVYVNRAIKYTGLTLHASNWKRIVLGGVLMASKVWDDQAVWNVDFCSIYPRISVEDMNDLERTYLEMLEFNINVDSSVYAKYYFELRALAERCHKDFPLRPLSKEQAAKLEAMSQSPSSSSSQLRAAQSLDAERFTSKAIIS